MKDDTEHAARRLCGRRILSVHRATGLVDAVNNPTDGIEWMPSREELTRAAEADEVDRLTRERDEWRQAAGAEARLRRELLAENERLEDENDRLRDELRNTDRRSY